MFAAVALIGCDREHHPVAPSEPGAIGFGTVETRAGIDELKADGFGVWAIVNNSKMQNELLMERKVEYVGGEWVYEDIEYWLDDSIFTFVALYPYAKGSDNVAYNNGVVTLTVSETPATTDWLVAKNVTNTSVEDYDTTVTLQFQHVLTSVGLNIWRDDAKHKNDQMRIKSVTLGNIRKSGRLSNADTWSYTNEKLTKEYTNSNLSDTDNIGAVIVKDDGTLDSGGSKALNPFGQMMLLPQTLDADNSVSLKIVYELKRQNAADWEEAELETVLPSITWNAGQRYTYNVVLSSVTDITVYYIQTKVDPWGTPQVGGTVIIK